jgi:hypothetical protein
MRCSSSLLFFPKANNNSVISAGLLACPVICTFPSRTLATVALDSDSVFGLTAAGTAPELHRIPSFIPVLSDGNRNTEIQVKDIKSSNKDYMNPDNNRDEFARRLDKGINIKSRMCKIILLRAFTKIKLI